MSISWFRRSGGASIPVRHRSKSGRPVDFKGGGPAPGLVPAQAAATTYLGGTGRGQYLWYEQDHPAPVPPGLPDVVDSYDRMLWREVEVQEGVYQWGQLDARLTQAQARGGRHGIRFMPFHQGWPNCLPDDVAALPSTRDITLDGVTSRLPDWNDPAYLARWDQLMAAAAARYDNDPRLYSIDVSGYGNWGEGHNYPYEDEYPGPGGETEGTTATLQAIIRSATDHWHNTWIYYNPQVLRSSGTFDLAGSAALINYALGQSDRVGVRTDALGGGDVQSVTYDTVMAAQQAAISVPENDRPLGRWRIAPATAEWSGLISPGGAAGEGSFQQGAQQVRDWHISMVPNANFYDDDNGYVSFSDAERAAFDDACRVSGYRYAVSGVRFGMGSGSAGLAVTWVNAGSAPTYDQWAVSYQLTRVDTGAEVTAASSLDLRSVAQGAVVDAVALAGVQPGAHVLAVRATNTTCPYASPLRFASGDRDGQGWHALGDIDLT